MSKIVAKYHGVNVIESCGYYYSEVNQDVELKSIKAVKEWIENIWMFVDMGLENLSIQMDVPKNIIKNFILNM